MLANVEQRQVLGLAVDIDQVGANLAHQVQAGVAPVHAGCAAPFAAQLTAERQIIGIIQQVFAFQDLLQRFAG